MRLKFVVTIVYNISSGSTEATEVLVGAGADVNAKGYNGNTPLILAANGGHTNIARLLLGHPNINIHEVVTPIVYLQCRNIHVLYYTMEMYLSFSLPLSLPPFLPLLPRPPPPLSRLSLPLSPPSLFLRPTLSLSLLSFSRIWMVTLLFMKQCYRSICRLSRCCWRLVQTLALSTSGFIMRS